MELYVGSCSSYEASEVLDPFLVRLRNALDGFLSANPGYQESPLFIGVILLPKTGASDELKCRLYSRGKAVDVHVELEYKSVVASTPQTLRRLLEAGVIRAVRKAAEFLGTRNATLRLDKMASDLKAYVDQQDWSLSKVPPLASVKPLLWHEAFGCQAQEMEGMRLFASFGRHARTLKSARLTKLRDALKSYEALEEHVGDEIGFLRPDNTLLQFSAVDRDTFRVQLAAAERPTESVCTKILPEEGIEMIQVFYHGGDLESVYAFDPGATE